MKRTAVINVVGLSESVLGEATPLINGFLQRGAKAEIIPAFPAVTCTAQANYVTGAPPDRHGIVGNGWYHRELAEVHFWKQPDSLVQAPKLWDDLRAADPTFTCAKLFWWFNLYSKVDWSVTPRPIYRANGRKLFDIYAWPYDLRTDLTRALGEFPFPAFWGPAAGLDTSKYPADAVSRWIAGAAKWVETKHRPTLNLIYLPHLDYGLQRLGPQHPSLARDLREIDAIVGDLLAFFHQQAVQVVLLSEYGVTPVDTPIHLNRLFRQQGWVAIKDERGYEILDCGASRVFAVADHQVAHIYLNERSLEPQVRRVLEEQPGIQQLLGEGDKITFGLGHPRAGDLVAVAGPRAWFSYYYWLDDRRAPDFARTVDIHRKPGYDPVELFLDPANAAIRLKVALRLLQNRLGFRTLMDVVPLDATLVRGSHGRRPEHASDCPLLIVERPQDLPKPLLDSTEVYKVLRNLVTG